MSDLADDLRIIATETGRLSTADRSVIASAAIYLESAINRAVALDRDLLEANAHRIALTDQLMAERRKSANAAPAALPWSMGTGWLQLEVTTP